MSDSTVIACSVQSNDRWILHGRRQKPRKNTLRACSAIIAFLKRLGAIVVEASIPPQGDKAFPSIKRFFVPFKLKYSM